MEEYKMAKKKKEETKEEVGGVFPDEEIDMGEAVRELSKQNQELRNALASYNAQLQQYVGLCAHYEQTINVLTGRIQEITRANTGTE